MNRAYLTENEIAKLILVYFLWKGLLPEISKYVYT